MTHEWTDRLSEYHDGCLSPEDATAVEAHLAECAECAEVLDGLRAVAAQARGLEDTPPSHDLWAGIREAIAPVAAPRVIDLASRMDPVERVRRRVSLSVPQLVAAALALVFASGGTTWMVRSNAADVGSASLPAPGTAAVAVASSPGGEGALPDDSQTEELAELEELLAQHRSELSPTTVRILEKNISAIDRAIRESLDALAVDPGNDFLEGHLQRSRERKLEYLREASAAFQWST